MSKLIFVIVLAAIIFAAYLYLVQRRMIYFPRRYPPDLISQLSMSGKIVPLRYRTDEGQQVSFYIPPQNQGENGGALWVLFSGNASMALNWLPFAADYADHSARFLLIDYPGYGVCEGEPSPAGIHASTEAALGELAKHLGVDVTALEQNLGVVGHSLGAATALLFAADHPLKQAVLVSPFTSMFDMACRRFRKPLCYLLRDRYDNRERIRELRSRARPPRITVVHGENDEVIPVLMSRELKVLFSEISYYEIQGGAHNTIIDSARAVIYGAMLKQPDGL